MLIDLEAIELIAKELRASVQVDDIGNATRHALKLSSRRVARELADASPESTAAVLEAMEPVKAGRVAGYLRPGKLAAVIEAIPPAQGVTLLSRIPADHAGQFVRALPADQREQLLAQVDPSARGYSPPLAVDGWQCIP